MHTLLLVTNFKLFRNVKNIKEIKYLPSNKDPTSSVSNASDIASCSSLSTSCICSRDPLSCKSRRLAANLGDSSKLLADPASISTWKIKMLKVNVKRRPGLSNKISDQMESLDSIETVILPEHSHASAQTAYLQGLIVLDESPLRQYRLLPQFP